MTPADRRLRTAQRASAIYDLIAVTPFAVPGVAAWQVERLHETAVRFSIPGDFPTFLPAHLFFASVFGIFTVTWSILRLRNTEPRYAVYDVILRFSFASTMLVYILAYDVTRVLLVFVGFELFWGALQLFTYARRLSCETVLPSSR